MEDVVPDTHQYVHLGSGECFDSELALTDYPRGWEAGVESDL